VTEIATENWIVIAGSFTNGFEFYGPFANEQEAIDFSGPELNDDAWTIAKLIDPRLRKATGIIQ
jgi:hypothetical protein